MHSVYIVIDTRNSYGIYTVRPTGFGGASAENPFRHVFNFKLFSFNLTFRWMNSRANESLNVRFVWNQDVGETVRREREKSELTRQFSFQTKNTRENSLVGRLLGVGRTFFFFFYRFRMKIWLSKFDFGPSRRDKNVRLAMRRERPAARGILVMWWRRYG